METLLSEACPALSELSMRGSPLRHYWSADETEWATDVMFRSPEALAELYPSLIRHAMTTFGSSDVMRFLGRQGLPRVAGVHPTFQGEVVSDLKRRPEGVRIKHRVNANSIKMYDKQGSVLRIETTINDAATCECIGQVKPTPLDRRKPDVCVRESLICRGVRQFHNPRTGVIWIRSRE